MAQLDLETELSNARLGIIDEDICLSILEGVYVSITGVDAEPIFTVRHMGEVRNSRQVIGNMYTVTATQKTSSQSTTVHGVAVWISITWIDHFGTNNQFVSVSGGWTPNGRTLTNREVSYGANQLLSLEGWRINVRGIIQNEFNYSESGRGFSLWAESRVNSAGHTNNPITLRVQTRFWH